MTYLTLGTLNIPVAWLAFLLAILYSDFRGRKADPSTNKILEYVLILYVIIWKFSYVLFSFSDFLKAPLSLLYFDGGVKGHAFALIVLSIYLYRKRNSVTWLEMWSYWARFVSVYSIVFAIFEQQWLFAALWFIVLLLVERKYYHGLLLVQLLLLIYQDGFLANITIVQLVVIVSIILLTKKLQFGALLVIVCLLAIMLGDIEMSTNKTTRTNIHLPSTTGEMYRLDEKTEQVTVVNFFATWCPPCKAEMPHLENFSQQLPTGVQLIGVNLTARDHGEEALSQFMDKFNVSYPILLDETDEFGTAFQVLSIPTTVILNADGEELTRIVGPITDENLRKIVRRYNEK